MATWIRRIVSGQKKRFQNEGFDLDLAYISPRIIAMGLPAEGKDVLYRNPLPEIARFLQTYHKGRSKVYNLCSEYKYSARKLSVPLEHYPFDDHQTPALLVVQQFCADAADWLARHPLNVVVVHCKAGKGRTGLMICCLLMYLHKNSSGLANLPATADDAEPMAAASPAATREGFRDLSTSSIPAADIPAPAAVTTANPFATRSLGPCSSDSSSSYHSALGRSSSAGGSTITQQPRTAASGGLLRTTSLPGVDRRGYGWHPWQHVEPVQLQQLSQPVQDILALYAERRTHDGNGVTIASQRRYVQYFWHVLTAGPQPCGLLPQPKALQLRQLVVSGLPAGTVDGCSVLVEARPSGSTAASATRVWLSPARRSSVGAMPGLQLCMGPCTLPPQVQDDQCSVTVSPAGDSLTIQLPAASLGLSLFSRGAAAATAGATQAAAALQINNYMQPAAATTIRPADELQSPFAAAATAIAGTPGPADCSSSGNNIAKQSVAADSCSITEAGDLSGCCVVEGDVRISVIRGGSKLFFAWFNTAFVPADGSFTLSRDQLDKVAKNVPKNLKLAVQYVSMQPQAGLDADVEATAAQEQHQTGYVDACDCARLMAADSGISRDHEDAPVRLTLPNSSSTGSLVINSDLLQLGSSVSAPASPQASRMSSWLQFPALSSLGSLPAPLQWPGGNSSSSDLADPVISADVAVSGFSSAPAARAHKRAARRERRGRSKASGRPGSDTTGAHFWDWSWEGLVDGTTTPSAETGGDVAHPPGSGSLRHASDLQQPRVGAASAGVALRQNAVQNLQPQHQESKVPSKAVTAGIELHAFSRPIMAAAAAAPTVASKLPQLQQQQEQNWVGSAAEDEDDGGDVFITDIYGPSDSWDHLLQASPPSAVSGILLSAHDPLQGLLEAWHFSLDTRASRQQQRRQTLSCSSASSSRPGSPVPDGLLTKRHSCPSAPVTPGRSSRTSVGRAWGMSAKGSAAARSYPSMAAAAAVDGPACNQPSRTLGRTASDQGLCVTSMRLDTAAAPNQATIAAPDATLAPVTPPPSAPVPPVWATSATGLTASSGACSVLPGPPAVASTASCCLECLFDMHTGPCPLSQPTAEINLSAKFEAAVNIAATAVAAAAATQQLQPSRSTVEGTSAGTGPIADGCAMRRSASTPDSRTAAAASAAASCTVKLVADPAAEWSGLSGASVVRGSGSAAAPTVTKGQWILAPNTPRVSASATPATAGIGRSISRRSIDLFGRKTGTVIAKSGSSSDSRNLQTSVPRRSTTGDLAASSISSQSDDQMQGLLQCEQLFSSAACADQAAAGRKSVAALVQQWQQLENAWQRNWL